jgi:hypothetical protein
MSYLSEPGTAMGERRSGGALSFSPSAIPARKGLLRYVNACRVSQELLVPEQEVNGRVRFLG